MNPTPTVLDLMNFLDQFDSHQHVHVRAEVLERDPHPTDPLYCEAGVRVFGWQRPTVAQLIQELTQFDQQDVLRFEAAIQATGTRDDVEKVVVRHVVFDRFDDSRHSLSHITTGHPSGRIVAVRPRVTIRLRETDQEITGGVLVQLTELPALLK